MLFITTPYLIIDSVIRNSLINAVKRGVEVNIFLPHIPDKKIIFLLSKCNYIDLIKRFYSDEEINKYGVVAIKFKKM